ncbi:hypothetical protein GOP47_0000144 [Adiantum capillus-veneris]|uniref:Cation/H+ exchanger domain-containing protein n=1 Tax=Adiantum capillus-veneris TaxID=13818 RepID=A0A9D4VDE0_ADICA|nr:hypothetical protein GOP47_0000144 [Adiantum capillus-veneris]
MAGSPAAENSTACPTAMAATSNGVWQGDSPVDFALPLLILQICLVLLVTRALAVLLKPLRQPRVIAEIIGGVLLGPSALGRIASYKEKVFPKESLTLLETVADLGLLLFLFLVGLELDLTALRRTGKHALIIAAAGITLPFVAGVGVSIILHQTISSDSKFAPFLVFMGVALSITAFPVLARILAERRLLMTDVGQMAMSAAAVNDVAAWVLLALAVALSGSGKSPLIALWVLLCGVAFVAFMFIAAKPLMVKVARQATESEPVNEMYVAFTLAAVLVSGFVTDAIGIHSIFGAFVFGLVIPKHGPFAGLLTEKIEDLVTILLLPLYFAVSGLKTNIGSINGAQAGGLLVLVITTACGGKIIGTFLVAYLSKMGVRKSLTLGFLMNTKGLVELIVLNIGKDRKVLNEETFAIMVIMALFTTFITTPMIMWLYKPARNPVPYTRRTLYAPNEKVTESELRLLACVHGMPNVHAIINLVEAVRGTRRRALHMYILHMVQLSERPSSIMKVQRVRREGRPFWDNQSNSCENNSIMVAFEAFGQLSKVTVRPMTAISRFDDMHEDICITAEDKRAAVIILPFHKHVVVNGQGWEGNSSGLRHVTQRVLQHAPCSVGILVDRGIGMMSHPSSSVNQNVAVLFYGGPDDREALAFGYRVAEHPGVRLTVYRFVYVDPPEDHVTVTMARVQSVGREGSGLNRLSMSSKYSNIEPFMCVAHDVDWELESRLDDECLTQAKGTGVTKGVGDNSLLPITYEEKEVSGPLEAALAVGKMDGWSLVIVGRGRRPACLITALLGGPQMEYPELGPVGCVLTRAPLSEVHCSVLVVQQYDAMLAKEVPVSSKVMDISTPKPKGLLSPNLVVVTGPSLPSPT